MPAVTQAQAQKSKIVRDAEAAEALFYATVFYNGSWSPVAWRRIENKLRLEACVAAQGDIEALCRFFTILRVSVQYLLQCLDREKARSAVSLVGETLRSFCHHGSDLRDEGILTAEEVAELHAIHRGLGLLVTVLCQNYPGIL